MNFFGILPPFHGDVIAEKIVFTCFWLIVICIISSLITLFSLFVYKFYAERKDQRVKSLEDKYMVLLSGVIFGDEGEEEQRLKLIQHFKKRYLKNKLKRIVLRKQLLKLHQSITGNSADILIELYNDLKLYKDPLKVLKETDWSRRAEAVRELVQVRYLRVIPKLEKLARHENHVLRLEAQLGLIALSEEHPFHFLNHTKSVLTKWHQICLKEMAKKMNPEKLPEFSQWFHSPNASVIEFSLNMTVSFNQFGASIQIVDLLQHKNEGVRKLAIRALGTMMVTEASFQLMNIYYHETESNQIEILKTLAIIGDSDTIQFLENVMLNEPHEQALNAAFSLKFIGSKGIDIMNKIIVDSQSSERLKNIASHVLA